MTKRSNIKKEFKPYVIVRPDIVPQYYIVMEQSWCAVRVVSEGIRMAGVYYGCYDTTILEIYLPTGEKPRYRTTERTLQSVLTDIKDRIEKQGCSPEALLLLYRQGWLTEEEVEMAKAKLENKGEVKAAKPAKAEVEAKTASKKGGNPEALAKAREAGAAKRSALRDKKIKALVKITDIKGREGTFRRTMLEDLLKSNTVAAFMDKDDRYDSGCIRFAEESGYVSLS